MHFCFWGHVCLSDRSISKYYIYPKRDKFMSWKKFNFQSVSRSWHMILLIIWKCSAWAVYSLAVVLSVNGNSAAHCSVLKKKKPNKQTNAPSVFVRIQLKCLLFNSTGLFLKHQWPINPDCTRTSEFGFVSLHFSDYCICNSVYYFSNKTKQNKA